MTKLPPKGSDGGSGKSDLYAQILKALAACRCINEIARTELGADPEEVKKALLKGAEALQPNVKRLRAHIDGASRGNPGKAGAGVVIYDEKGEVLEEDCIYLGETTNNVAEYRALLLALEIAEKRGAEEFQVFADSELVVNQVTGRYRVRNPILTELHVQAMKRITNLRRFEMEHVPREENKRADRLANMAIDAACREPHDRTTSE